jgi:6-phospho-beta-glucosidase
MGFKTIPAILEIAKAIDNYAVKDCYLINLANPS